MLDAVFILSGGLGTRLRSVVQDVPKPMADINGEPFLNFQIRQIRKHFPKTPIYLLTGYLTEVVEAYYDDWDHIHVIAEKERLGTGGAVKHALSELGWTSAEKTFLLLNGDTYTEVDLKALCQEVDDTCTCVGSFQSVCDRYGTLEISDGDKVVGFAEKQEGVRDHFINAGLYLFQHSELFDGFPEGNVSLEERLVQYIQGGHTLGFYPYRGTFIDIGIPEDYEKMQSYGANLNVLPH